jgi:hypothetical protein
MILSILVMMNLLDDMWTKMKYLYTDEHDRSVFDVTQDLQEMKLLVLGKNIVKAEKCDTNILILQSRAGGHWYITYWWQSQPNKALNEIAGSEVIKFSRKEIDPTISLFKQVRLF